MFSTVIDSVSSNSHVRPRANCVDQKQNYNDVPISVGCQKYCCCFIGVIVGLTTVYKLCSSFTIIVNSAELRFARPSSGEERIQQLKPVFDIVKEPPKPLPLLVH